MQDGQFRASRWGRIFEGDAHWGLLGRLQQLRGQGDLFRQGRLGFDGELADAFEVNDGLGVAFVVYFRSVGFRRDEYFLAGIQDDVVTVSDRSFFHLPGTVPDEYVSLHASSQR